MIRLNPVPPKSLSTPNKSREFLLLKVLARKRGFYMSSRTLPAYLQQPTSFWREIPRKGIWKVILPTKKIQVAYREPRDFGGRFFLVSGEGITHRQDFLKLLHDLEKNLGHTIVAIEGGLRTVSK